MIRKLQKNAVYLLVLIIPFVLFFIFPLTFRGLKSHVIDFASPVVETLSKPFFEIKKILYYHWTFDEYKRLKKENDTLKTRFIGFEETSRENIRLHKLLDLKDQMMYSSIAAHVIGRNPTFWNSSFIINKGKKNGLKVGMPVVSDLGVVGKVSEIWDDKSKVILLTDPQFSVAAIVERTRDSGLVSGSLQGLCRMRFMDVESKVAIGDQVITSKLSYFFPENLVVGEIVGIEEDQATATRMCLIKPAAHLSEIEEVLVITK